MSEQIYQALIGGLLMVINAYFWIDRNRMRKEIDQVKEDMTAMKTNYIKRFEEVNQNISQLGIDLIRAQKESEINLLKAINTLRMEIDKNFVRKEQCEHIHIHEEKKRVG